MTTHTTDAREAAARAQAKVIAERHADGKPVTERDIDYWDNDARRDESNAAIDAFLSKSLEGADGRVAEIREIDRDEKHLAHDYLDHPRLRAHRTELLAIVTALSAEKQELAMQALSLSGELEALQSELAATRKALEEISQLDKFGGYNSACHMARKALEPRPSPQVKG